MLSPLELSMGVTAIVARRTGEGDIKGAFQTAVQAILGVFVAVIVSIIGIITPEKYWP